MGPIKKTRNVQYLLTVFTAILGIAGCVGLLVPMVSPASAAWVEPGGSPPGGNVAAPINVSGTAQTKQGALTVQGLFQASGGISVTGSSAGFGLQATSPAATSETTAGLFGTGSTAAASTSSVGVYGISGGIPGSGTHIGLLGVAGANSANSVGVYGWDQNFATAYAGYFVGKVGISGKLCFGSGESDCITKWSEIDGGAGGESLWSQAASVISPKTSGTMDVAIGGTNSTTADFFFDVSSGMFTAPGSVTIGLPTVPAAGDGICQATEGCASTDCRGEVNGCPEGKYCDPAGSSCIDIPAEMLPDTTPPTVPSNLAVNGSIGSGTVPLAWDASSDPSPGSGVAGYDLYRCQGESCTPTSIHQANISETTFRDAVNVQPVTRYGYAVKAKDNAGNISASSPIRYVDTPARTDTTPPSNPQNLALEGVEQAFCFPLSWDPSVDEPGGSGVAGYWVYICSGAGCTPNTKHYPYLISESGICDLEPGTTYSIELSGQDNATNESGRSNRLTATTLEFVDGEGGSPAILKKPIKGGGGASSLPNQSIAAESPRTPTAKAKVAGTKPLSRSITSLSSLFRIPSAAAAPPFGGSTQVRLTVNNGVIQIKDGATILEIGNAGTDLASTSDINLRPRATTTGGEVRIGSTTNVGKLCLYGTGSADCKDRWPLGGGGITDISQVIWNTQAGTPLGGFPQTPAAFKIAGQGQMSTLIVGPDNSAIPSAATLYASDWLTGNGKVGVGILSPTYKLDVAGDINISSGSFYRVAGTRGVNDGGICGGVNTIVSDLTIQGGIVTGYGCEVDDSSSSGTVSGSGAASYLPKWKSPSELENSIIREDSNRIGINHGPPFAATLDIMGGLHVRDEIFIDGNNDGQPDILTKPGDYILLGGDISEPKAKLSVSNGGVWVKGNNDVVVGGTDYNDITNPNAAEFCFWGTDGSCIDSWADLIQNTASFSLPSGQPAGFYITGDGRIGEKLTVDVGPIELPVSNRTNFHPRIERVDSPTTPIDGYYLTNKFIIGGASNAYGLGFFSETNTTSPIFTITEPKTTPAISRQVHLGSTTIPTQLCLYGTEQGGAAGCRDSWPAGGGGVVTDINQVIWNSLASTPLGTFPQNNTSFNIAGQGRIGNLIVGPNDSLNPTAATLYASDWASGVGKVGIGTMDPVEKLDVAGAIKLGSTANTNAGTIRYSGTDLEGYVGGAWKSLTAGGAVATTDQVIWNTQAATGLGSFPQTPAGFKITGQGQMANLIVGPDDTANPAAATLYASDWASGDGRVGIGTMASGTAKLAVMGGNVGIGRTDPIAELSVVGSLHIGFNTNTTKKQLIIGTLSSPHWTVQDFVWLTNTNGDYRAYINGGLRVDNDILVDFGRLGIIETGTSPSRYTYFQGGDQTLDITYTLPPALPDVPGKVLASDTSGVLSWSQAAGAVATTDQVIWNTQAATGLGSFPQTPAGFKIAGQGQMSTLVVGPNDSLSPTAATLYSSGWESGNGKVGIGTMAPATTLDVAGGIRAIGSESRFGKSGQDTSVFIEANKIWRIVSGGDTAGVGSGNLGFYSDTDSVYVLGLHGNPRGVSIGSYASDDPPADGMMVPGKVVIGTKITNGLLTLSTGGSAFDEAFNTLTSNNRSTGSFNAIAGYKRAGAGSATVQGSGVYGELQNSLTCTPGGVCSGITGSDGSALIAYAGKYAGYFQGNVNINGSLSINGSPWSGQIQCPPLRVPVNAKAVDDTYLPIAWITYDSCALEDSATAVRLTNPKICEYVALSSNLYCYSLFGLTVPSPLVQTYQRQACFEFGFANNVVVGGTNTNATTFHFFDTDQRADTVGTWKPQFGTGVTTSIKCIGGTVNPLP